MASLVSRLEKKMEKKSSSKQVNAGRMVNQFKKDKFPERIKIIYRGKNKSISGIKKKKRIKPERGSE